jgi:hypothetical protein
VEPHHNAHRLGRYESWKPSETVWFALRC